MLISAIMPTASVAQDQHVIDSLQRVVAGASHDSLRFDALLGLAGERIDSDPEAALGFCVQAREIAEATGRPADLGEAEGWLGYIEEQRGHSQLALQHYSSSLRRAELLRDTAGIATVLNNMGAIFKDQGRIADAIGSHTRSLMMRTARNDSAGIATSLNNIGLILYDQGRVTEATEHFADALRIYERIGDPDGVSTALHNIAGIYRDQGDHAEALAYFQRALLIQKGQGDLYSQSVTEDNLGGVLESQGSDTEAASHYHKALELHAHVGDTRGMGYSLRNIAGIELRNGRPDSAYAHARRALELFNESDDKRGRASALWMAGQALHRLGRRAEAESAAYEALALGRELGYPQQLRDAAELLARLHREKGEWKKALEMQDLYHVMRDSVMNQDARRSTIRQQYRYAYERKEAELRAEQAQRDLRTAVAMQQERDRRNLLLTGGIGILVVALGLFSRVRRLRRSRAEIQRERDVSDSLLLNILPEEVAAELKEKGAAEARLLENVTVLFTDFKDFTRMAERLSPQELVHDINQCFSAFDRICEKHGIEKIKTIGDAYMAAGGLPVPNLTHARDVVAAALEMRDFIAEEKARRMTAGRPYFEIRIGVHTGPVVAGIVGVKKFQYDIWGDTVNTASRMESSGEAGRVNISETTYALVEIEPGLAFIGRGKVQVKGKGEMEMHFVERDGPTA